MAKIITAESKINELLDRGVEKIYPSREELKKKLMSGKQLRIYCGYDPSANSLHIGNAITINKLAQFRELGHEVIFLIGDFTGMIGDPDKMTVRKKMTRMEVLGNAKNFKKQASAYLSFSGSNPAQVKYNSKWLDKTTFLDLIELAANFTVQQMIIRDMFQERMKQDKPIYLHEFLYPLAQAYDSVMLDVDVEVGGNDQMFNMMCGRDLQRIINNKDKIVLTMKLLADEQGNKMGKTEGNALFLNRTPEDMYGIIMSWSDNVIGPGFELCTKLPLAEVNKIKEDLKKGENPRDAKMKLAYEITKLVYGDAKAKTAQEKFIKTFQKKEIPDELEIIKLKVESMNIIDLLDKTGLVASKSEAKRLIAEKAIKIDSEIINDISKEIKITSQGFVLQRGKKQFKKIVRAL
ncbi:MAG: tyrosine--tRNA ligase [Candidatus Falkowbacteria bacterium]|nr:tyrosine--tRNA ligase [Candidatus Falkowbacteria bacterium]